MSTPLRAFALSLALRRGWLHRDRASLPALAVVLLLLWAAEGGTFGWLPREIADAARNDGPNLLDSGALARDYYRGLLGESAETRRGWLLVLARKLALKEGGEIWPESFFDSTISRPAAGFPFRELVPDAEIVHEGAGFRTNSLGLRDDPCELVPPAGTRRIVLIGASNDVGWAVPHELCYEAQLERLLAARPDAGAPVEVLNLSVPGYTMLEHVWSFEERAPAFRPDLALLTVNLADVRTQMVERLASRIRSGRDLRFGFVRDAVARSGAAASDSIVEICRKLQPFQRALFRGAFEEIARISRESGVQAAILVTKLQPGRAVHSDLRWAADAAEAAGLPVLRCFDALADLTSTEAYLDPSRDLHPSPRAHAALAAELLDKLRGNPALRRVIEGSVPE